MNLDLTDEIECLPTESQRLNELYTDVLVNLDTKPIPQFFEDYSDLDPKAVEGTIRQRLGRRYWHAHLHENYAESRVLTSLLNSLEQILARKARQEAEMNRLKYVARSPWYKRVLAYL